MESLIIENMKTTKAKLFLGVDHNSQKVTFLFPKDGIDFALSLVSRIEDGSKTTYFEMQIRGSSFILQCQEAGCFLQIFLQSEVLEGWCTAVDDEIPVGELSTEEDELVVPCYEEEDAPIVTHFRLIGIEGAWISRLLLISKEHALLAMKQIYLFERTGTWSNNRKWVNLGLM
ncbi:hypothetical protein IWQ51_001141 [Labrenzia sp. EL_142]|nr:hypothetical protein [Labrenzia sp. EL_142]